MCITMEKTIRRKLLNNHKQIFKNYPFNELITETRNYKVETISNHKSQYYGEAFTLKLRTNCLSHV